MSFRPKGRSPRRPFHPKRFEHGAPISTIDTRPMALLAVCLCAIGMILFKPIPHAIMVDLWDGETEHPLIIPKAQTETERAPITNRLTLSDDEMMHWNGERINAGQLFTLLDAVSQMEEAAILEFEPEADASYDLAARILQILTQSGAQFQITGMENYCAFGSPRHLGGRNDGVLTMAHSIWIPSDAPLVTPYSGPLGEGTCEPRMVVHGAR